MAKKQAKKRAKKLPKKLAKKSAKKLVSIRRRASKSIQLPNTPFNLGIGGFPNPPIPTFAFVYTGVPSPPTPPNPPPPPFPPKSIAESLTASGPQKRVTAPRKAGRKTGRAKRK
jgi:hypothetical protein